MGSPSSDLYRTLSISKAVLFSRPFWRHANMAELGEAICKPVPQNTMRSIVAVSREGQALLTIRSMPSIFSYTDSVRWHYSQDVN